LPDHQALQSLKEFYEDQRSRYASPTELEMLFITNLSISATRKNITKIFQNPLHPILSSSSPPNSSVQQKSAPISKTSRLIVAEEGMQIFGQLVTVLSKHGNRVMVYLFACLLEGLFGTDTIDDIAGIRADLSTSDIIDGATSHGEIREVQEVDDENVELDDELGVDDYLEAGDEEYENAEAEYVAPQPTAPVLLKPNATFTQPPSVLSQNPQVLVHLRDFFPRQMSLVHSLHSGLPFFHL
jgi:nuclear mRNA export protein SAC3